MKTQNLIKLLGREPNMKTENSTQRRCRFVFLNICRVCVCAHRGVPCGPLCLHLLTGAHRVISHGNQWTRGENGGGGDWKRKKSLRKAGYLLSLMEGYPRGGRAGRERRGKTWIHWEKTACLAWRESRQLSILIKASQPARRRQKTMAGSIGREGKKKGAWGPRRRDICRRTGRWQRDDFRGRRRKTLLRGGDELRQEKF